jgi:anti-sigma regulatory factor (Ser/Thr protein kinase)
MLRSLKADLHVHTCLSPCAELNMGPRAIVSMAARRGLDVIGVTDHNSSENTPAVLKAAGRKLVVLPGMEVTSREEAHILALFDSIENAFCLQRLVYDHLTGENDEDAFGLQVVVDENHDVLGINNRLLAGATDLSVEQVVESIHQFQGVAIASHVDRPAFGIIGQLGFIPAGLPLDALELSRNTTVEEARRKYPEHARRTFVRFSDAHAPDDVGAATTWFVVSKASVVEIRKALRGDGGRRVLPLGKKRSQPEGVMEELALHILDIAENAIGAGAGRVKIQVRESRREDRMCIEILDDGAGMDAATAARATDPFFTTRTTRRVGLGLPLFEQAAKAAGGEFRIESRPGAGTKVTAVFRLSHIDRQPLGDMGETLLALVVGHPATEFEYAHRTDDTEVWFRTEEVKAQLKGTPIGSPEGISAVRRSLERLSTTAAGQR